LARPTHHTSPPRSHHVVSPLAAHACQLRAAAGQAPPAGLAGPHPLLFPPRGAISSQTPQSPTPPVTIKVSAAEQRAPSLCCPPLKSSACAHFSAPCLVSATEPLEPCPFRWKSLRVMPPPSFWWAPPSRGMNHQLATHPYSPPSYLPGEAHRSSHRPP
jgi:hypothetical protein